MIKHKISNVMLTVDENIIVSLLIIDSVLRQTHHLILHQALILLSPLYLHIPRGLADDIETYCVMGRLQEIPAHLVLLPEQHCEGVCSLRL